MGLDMYALVTDTALTTPVDFEPPAHEQLFYWRKHPNLHGWMEALYREKGGRGAEFNCVNLQLTKEDIDRLELAVKSGSLPETSGFFFGRSDGSESNDDLAFVTKARTALEAGRSVFYHPWW